MIHTGLSQTRAVSAGRHLEGEIIMKVVVFELFVMLCSFAGAYQVYTEYKMEPDITEAQTLGKCVPLALAPLGVITIRLFQLLEWGRIL